MSAAISSKSLPPRPGILASQRDDRKGFRLSLAFHVLLAAFIVVKSLVFPGKPASYVPTLRVDLVGLPDQLKSEMARVPKAPPDSKIAEALKQAEQQAREIKPPPVKAKAPSEAERAEKDEMVLKPKIAANAKEQEKSREKRLKSALDRIKALEKISGESQSDRARKAASVLIKGNAISKGTSLSGDAKEAAEASYYDLVRDKLQANWALPVWLSRQSLSAQVVIYIDKQGRLRNLVFQKNSGNPQFDDAVKKAITASQPFDPPPAGIADDTLSNGIRVGFPL